MSPVTVLRANFDDPAHGAAIVGCLDAYARDPMGGQTPLPDAVRAKLIAGLRGTPNAMVWLAQDGDDFVGVVTAFSLFSTFSATARWNIHDVAVNPEARGRGVGRALLERVIADATAAGAGSLSLEVRHDNEPARHLYSSLGFGDTEDPMAFWFRRIT